MLYCFFSKVIPDSSISINILHALMTLMIKCPFTSNHPQKKQSTSVLKPKSNLKILFYWNMRLGTCVHINCLFWEMSHNNDFSYWPGATWTSVTSKWQIQSIDLMSPLSWNKAMGCSNIKYISQLNVVMPWQCNTYTLDNEQNRLCLHIQLQSCIIVYINKSKNKIMCMKHRMIKDR